MAETNYLRYEWHADGVAVLVLDNPPLNLNAAPTLRLLRDRCREIERDERVRAVVVTGAGDRAFCAGSDVKEFEAVRDAVVVRKLALENEAFSALANLPVPVIAALNGVTLGGGAELALACDIRIMADTARIGFPEVRLGVFPGSGGVVRLPRLIGMARAYELLYTGTPIDAGAALRIGLVNRSVPAREVLPEALALAATIARGPARALAAIRRAVRTSLDTPLAAAIEATLVDSDAVFKGQDVIEGVRAFFEKRAPVFTATRAGRCAAPASEASP